MALANRGAAPPQAMPDADLPIHRVSLRAITNSARFRDLDRREAYWRGKQYDGLKYDWNGNFQGYGGEADIRPGWFVPLKRRKPSARMSLPKTIVARFTALLFGTSHWPEITVAGDEDATDYANALAKAARLPSKMIEARNLGGAQGTSCVSFGFRHGKPRVQVHNAKNVSVLRWAEPDSMVVGAVLEAYAYQRNVWVDGKAKSKTFFYARYWDRDREVLWAPIPAEIGNAPGWSQRMPHREVFHGYGFCPFYWIQNLPDSYDADGVGDFEGEEDQVDSVNRLLSATSKGTVANVDPTLVVKMDPTFNDGSVQKGSGQAIFSPGGADYLEISGTAVTAAIDLLKLERASVLEAVQCVIMDPTDAKAGVVSGEALRLKYAPMLAKCDLLRDQYGENGVVPIIRDMLRAARTIAARPPIIDEEGNATEAAVVLPPRVVTVEEEDEETGEKKRSEKKRKRRPGAGEDVTLTWGPYFPNTWTDIEKGIKAAKAAAGNKSVVSHRTAIQMVASMTGVTDVDAELRTIDEDAEMAADRAIRSFGALPPPRPGLPPPKAGAPGAPPGAKPEPPPKPGAKKPPAKE